MEIMAYEMKYVKDDYGDYEMVASVLYWHFYQFWRC